MTKVTENPFLQDLYPDPMKRRKGRIFKSHESYRSTAAYRFTPLGAKTKAQGVVSKRPEVMLRIGGANIKSYAHLIKSADYIARNGKIELWDQDGQLLSEKCEYRRKLYEWKILSDIGEEESRRGHARRIILSMPYGTEQEAFKAACRDWAEEMLAGFDYLIAFHMPGEDRKTLQPHCHILLRTISQEKKRFHLDNQELGAFREHLAGCLLRHGIEANATKRWSRGKTQKGVSQAEYNVIKNRSLTDQQRAQLYAMNKKRNLLRNQKKRQELIRHKFQEGSDFEDIEAIKRAKQTRIRVVEMAEKASNNLKNSRKPEDRALGTALQAYYSHLEPVESRDQKTLRLLNEEKARRIKRMQAMNKRKREKKQETER